MIHLNTGFEPCSLDQVYFNWESALADRKQPILQGQNRWLDNQTKSATYKSVPCTKQNIEQKAYGTGTHVISQRSSV